jgi:hypothetical protein
MGSSTLECGSMENKRYVRRETELEWISKISVGLSLVRSVCRKDSIGFYERLRYYNNESLLLLENTIQPYKDYQVKS